MKIIKKDDQVDKELISRKKERKKERIKNRI